MGIVKALQLLDKLIKDREILESSVPLEPLLSEDVDMCTKSIDNVDNLEDPC